MKKIQVPNAINISKVNLRMFQWHGAKWKVNKISNICSVSPYRRKCKVESFCRAPLFFTRNCHLGIDWASDHFRTATKLPNDFGDLGYPNPKFQACLSHIQKQSENPWKPQIPKTLAWLGFCIWWIILWQLFMSGGLWGLWISDFGLKRFEVWILVTTKLPFLVRYNHFFGSSLYPSIPADLFLGGSRICCWFFFARKSSSTSMTCLRSICKSMVARPEIFRALFFRCQTAADSVDICGVWQLLRSFFFQKWWGSHGCRRGVWIWRSL